MKTYNGLERMPRNYTMMADAYEFTMGTGYLMNNKKDNEAVFDVFFRKVPNNGGYAIMAGLDKIIPFLENLRFEENNEVYVSSEGIELLCKECFKQKYLEILENYKMELTEKYIAAGFPYYNFFHRN